MSVQRNKRAGKWETPLVRGWATALPAVRTQNRCGRVRPGDQATPPARHARPRDPAVPETLGEFIAEDWWPRYAIPNLAADTRRRYLEILRTHLLPRLGNYELQAITPLLVEDVRLQMARANVGAPTQRKVLMLLQGVLRRALVRGLIAANPVQVVDKPRQQPTRQPAPLPPNIVERIRARLRPRDAMLVSLLAYAGLRPSEDRSCRWGDVRDHTLHVLASKTHRERIVDLLAPLAEDLAQWRLMRGRPAADALIVPRPSGGEWTREDWANWRNRIWRPAAAAAGVTGDLRPYRLRCSFVCLLLWEGRSLTWVADQAGHSVATLAKHYAGVLAELEYAPRVRSGRGDPSGARRDLVCEPSANSRGDLTCAALRTCCKWPGWTMLGSNQRPPPCRGGALPAELIVLGAVTVA